MNCHSCSTALAIASGHCRYRISTKAPALTSQGGWTILRDSATRTLASSNDMGTTWLKDLQTIANLWLHIKAKQHKPCDTDFTDPVCIQAVEERCLNTDGERSRMGSKN
jgi:hypothetical protein